jgi:hypothetical protein
MAQLAKPVTRRACTRQRMKHAPPRGHTSRISSRKQRLHSCPGRNVADVRSVKHPRDPSRRVRALRRVLQNLEEPAPCGLIEPLDPVLFVRRKLGNNTVTRLLLLLGSRHTTRPAHAGVGGHHTTVSSLFFIAYPQTRVPAPSMLGPYADATGRSLQPMLDCSKPGLSRSTNSYPISPDLDPDVLL